MSCDACEAAREIDEETPPCETKQGCWVLPLDKEGQRLMDIREQIIDLKDLIDAGTILRAHKCNLEEIGLLAFIEREIRELRK